MIENDTKTSMKLSKFLAGIQEGNKKGTLNLS